MHFEPMSVDEFAKYKREEGMKVVKVDGIWWAEVRPFFFPSPGPFLRNRTLVETLSLEGLSGWLPARRPPSCRSHLMP
jgi:hypothetical protein